MECPSRERKEIIALNAKLEKLTNKNKADSEETKIKRNKRFEWKKIAPKDGSNTKEKHRKPTTGAKHTRCGHFMSPSDANWRVSQRSP